MRVIDVPCLTVLSQLFVFALNAVPPASSILSPVLLANNTIYEFSSPDNTTLANATYLLPRSPWIYHVPDTTIEVTVMYLQVIVVSEVDLLACLLNAANHVISHLRIGGSGFINEPELDWDSGPVRLRLNPGPQMTWLMWGATIEGLTHFLELYDPVSMYFDARDQLIGRSVGGGSIFNP